MTAFTQTDIPANVDTLEKLFVWAGTALHALNFDQTAIEGVGNPVRVAQSQVFFIDNTNENRLMLRGSLEIENNFTYSGEKIWTHVRPLNQADLPSEFLAA